MAMRIGKPEQDGGGFKNRTLRGFQHRDQPGAGDLGGAVDVHTVKDEELGGSGRVGLICGELVELVFDAQRFIEGGDEEAPATFCQQLLKRSACAHAKRSLAELYRPPAAKGTSSPP